MTHSSLLLRGSITVLLVLGLPACGDLLEGDLAADVVQRVASTEDNFRKSRSVQVLVEASDLALYRELLSEQFCLECH